MFVITLAPLTALPQPSDQLLHYFSKEKILPGQLVEITLNRRTLFGVVFACNDADTMRIAIKNSPYPLKNISSIPPKAETMLSQMQLQMALWISSYYYASLGVVLQAMLRPLGIKSMPPPKADQPRAGKKLPALTSYAQYTKPAKTTAALFVGDCPKKTYQEFITPENSQTLILVPERKDIEIYEKKFREIIPSANIRLFHSGLKLTQQRAVAKDALAGTPCVVIGTRSALLLPFQNLGTIIVENPSDTSHTSWDQNPHLNAARVAAWLHKNGFVSLLFHEEEHSVELMEYARLNRWDIQLSQQKKLSRGHLVDMRKELKEENKTIVSKNLKKVLIKSLEKNDVVFLYVQRRGFASGVVCRDCGFVVICPLCNVPMVYHDQGMHKFLLCHRCETKQQAPTICPSCQGNRIRFIGAGTQRVEDEVKKLFPNLSVCRLDSDAGHSNDFLLQARESLVKQKPLYNVFIGTNYAWGVLPPHSIDVGVIITLDGLLSLPDYRSQERVYGIIEKMEKVTKRGYLIQTYCPDAPVFSSAIASEWNAFAKKELGLRKVLKWPPFIQIIRMQYGHAQASVAQTQAQQALRLLQTQIAALQKFGEASEALAQCELLGPSPAYIDKVKNTFVWEIILKWPLDDHGNPKNLDLRNRLLAVLPRGWNIDVDPIDLV